MTIQPIRRIVIRGEQKENFCSIELLLISHSQSNGKVWFDKPFDGVYPEQGRRAQGKLTTSGSADCSAEAGAPLLRA
jgi:hypothetical protein